MGIGTGLLWGAKKIAQGEEKIARGLGKATEKGVKKLFKPAKDADGNIKKDFTNMYTGYQMKAVPNVALAAGAVGLGALTYSAGRQEQGGGFDGLATRTSKVGKVSYEGSPAIFDADGVGTQTKAPNLGASGDLVFGLHNGRRG